MIAYPEKSLTELEVLDQAKEWFDKKIISEVQYEEIKEAHHHHLFIPNIFLRIGLFFLTIILVNAALGLLSMFFIVMDPTESVMAGFSIFYGVIIIVGLEVVIINKKAFRAGIDEGMLYLGVFALIFGLCFLFNSLIEKSNNEFLFYSLIALPFFAAAAIRYLDNLMVFCAFICFQLIIFSLAIKLGNVGKAITPFLIMASSGAIYFYAKKYSGKEELSFWKQNLKVLQFLALLGFYLAGNYFVVRELTIEMFDLVLEKGEDIPFSFIFHLTTALVPLAFIYFGAKLKDKIIFWAGLLTIILSVLTFKYYYSLGNLGISLSVAGFLVSSIVWFCIKYFSPSKFEITSEKEDELISKDAEALIQTYSFSQHHPSSTTSHSELGGGDFGGGGAGGKF